MSPTADSLRPQLSQLSARDRAELAHFLIHSLDSADEELATAAFEEELKRRAAEIRQGNATGEPVETVVRELRAKYS
jgi:putative addiction module component (TIGR02574 family)